MDAVNKITDLVKKYKMTVQDIAQLQAGINALVPQDEIDTAVQQATAASDNCPEGTDQACFAEEAYESARDVQLTADENLTHLYNEMFNAHVHNELGRHAESKITIVAVR